MHARIGLYRAVVPPMRKTTHLTALQPQPSECALVGNICSADPVTAEASGATSPRGAMAPTQHVTISAGDV